MKKSTFSFLFILFLVSTGHGETHAVLSGKISNLKKDTIKIVLQINSITSQSETFFVPIINGKFEKELNISKPTYLYVTDGENYINGLIEPADSTSIIYKADDIASSLKFEGKGSEKFSFLNAFVRFRLYQKLKVQIPIAKGNKFPFDHMFKFIDSVGAVFLVQLNSIRSSMSPESFKLLKADIEGSIMGNKYRSVGMVYHESIDETLQKRQSELTTESKKYLQNILNFNNSLFYSTTYLNEVYNILFVHYDGLILANKADTDILKKYNYLNQLLPNSLKTPVLTLFIEHDIGILNQSEHIETVIKNTYVSVKDSIYKNFITKRYDDALSFKKGMKAPDFVLEDSNGEKITLSTFKGKVVYIDFWYTACGPCHALFETVKPAKEYFSKDSNVVFLYISSDPKDVWKKSLIKYDIKGYHAFTENKQSSHPIIKTYKVAGYPTTFLIDKNGNIFSANPSNKPDELKKQIEDALKVN